MCFTATLSFKYASDEASQDNCEAYLSFCESNDTLPRAPFTVQHEFEIAEMFASQVVIIGFRFTPRKPKMRFSGNIITRYSLAKLV
jgi:hypothetical protein